VLRTFGDKDTERFWNLERVSRFDAFAKTAERKLRLLDAATSLRDLGRPPSNRLEKLKGARASQHSIRINDQWRICFRWEAPHAYDVEVTDYH
jgi:proteic killer suppression protein